MWVCSFHRGACWLAFVAVVLLATLPTAGRLLSPVRGPELALGAICSSAGLTLPIASEDPSENIRDAPEPDRWQHAYECAYCPVLKGMAALHFRPHPPAVAKIQDLSAAPTRTIVVVSVHPYGLGSRGPPDTFRMA